MGINRDGGVFGDVMLEEILPFPLNLRFRRRVPVNQYRNDHIEGPLVVIGTTRQGLYSKYILPTMRGDRLGELLNRLDPNQGRMMLRDGEFNRLGLELTTYFREQVRYFAELRTETAPIGEIGIVAKRYC